MNCGGAGVQPLTFFPDQKQSGNTPMAIPTSAPRRTAVAREHRVQRILEQRPHLRKRNHRLQAEACERDPYRCSSGRLSRRKAVNDLGHLLIAEVFGAEVLEDFMRSDRPKTSMSLVVDPVKSACFTPAIASTTPPGSTASRDGLERSPTSLCWARTMPSYGDASVVAETCSQTLQWRSDPLCSAP